MLALDDRSIAQEAYEVMRSLGIREPDAVAQDPLAFGDQIRQFLGAPLPHQQEARRATFRQYLHLAAWTQALESYMRIPLLVQCALYGLMSLEGPND